MFSHADPASGTWSPRRRGGPARFAAFWPELVEDLRQFRLAEREAMPGDASALERGAPSAPIPHAA